jgi:hypothetical protein
MTISSRYIYIYTWNIDIFFRDTIVVIREREREMLEVECIWLRGLTRVLPS